MLHFDYVAMHHRCPKLLTRIRSELGEELDLNDSDKSSEMTLPTIVAAILFHVTGANQGDNVVPLFQASGILKETVEREGGEELMKMSLKGDRHGWLADGI